MKKGNSVKLLLAAIALGGSSAAMAAGPYIGLNYTQFQFESDDTDEKLKPDGVTLRAGIEFNDFIGLEARGATGVSSDKRSTALGDAEFDLDRLYGGYVKLSVPVGDMVRPYIVGGYTEAKGEAKFTTGLGSIERESDTVNDESYGAGVDFNLTETFGMNVEYMRYLDKDDYELNGISVGFRSAF
ncbi:hypothetical protein A167_03139 [Alcanivorax sp. S71-1-4]|uniref:porin family protein n=1 Tax=Alcanivorax sp. S71-1-4 TaxID=1177159 RepID=UPI00135C147E|nr:porin family protein [Alcanivorax sp. S71-1-4]KAF0806597.1 hypothetical protein A167_03139 [Alcanivorax sp. S71-1-4]